MPKFSDHEKICRRLADLLSMERKRQGPSLTQLASDAGLAQSSLSYFEGHQRTPTLKTLLRVADTLGVDLGEYIQRAVKDVRSGGR